MLRPSEDRFAWQADEFVQLTWKVLSYDSPAELMRALGETLVSPYIVVINFSDVPLGETSEMRKVSFGTFGTAYHIMRNSNNAPVPCQVLFERGHVAA